MRRAAAILMFLLIVDAQLLGGTRTCYVDPDASGAFSGADWTNAYASQAAAITGELAIGANLVAGTNNLLVYLKSSAGTADTSQALWNGFTTSSTYDIKIIMDGTNGSDQHAGVWSESKYRLEVNDVSPLVIYDDHVSVIGLQARTPAIDGADHIIFANYQGAGSVLKIEQCLVRGSNQSSGAQYAITTVDADADVYIGNNIIYDINGPAGARGIVADGDEVFVYNNTVIGGNRGIADGAPASRPTVLKNNICTGQTYACYYTGGAWDANSCNNISSDATAPGDNSKTSATPTFANAAGYDFHLAAGDTAAKDSGVDLNTDEDGWYNIAEDIDKDARDTVSGGTWDIGADEYDQSGGGGGGTSLIKKRLHFGKKGEKQ